jgi:GntR family galactonate operon transcriptional repressor
VSSLASGEGQPGLAAGYRADVVTYSGRGLHGRLVECVGRQIVLRQIAPGEIIDLDALAAAEDVSRTVVREAVKVLVGKGLLDARPKYGTFVRERSAWNLLDPEIMRWRAAAGPDPRLLRELEELRQMLEPVTARMAAQSRTAEHLEALEHALATMANERDMDAHVDADLQFHRVLAAASGNELLEHLAILLEPAQRTRDALAFECMTDDSFLAVHHAVLDGVRAGDPKRTETAMRRLLEEAGRDTEAAIERRTSKGKRGTR